jgi:hypothetical protein
LSGDNEGHRKDKSVDRKIKHQTKDSEISSGRPLKTSKQREQMGQPISIKLLLESLILAQDERWRYA